MASRLRICGVAACLGWIASTAHAQSDWFTVAGNPTNAAVDTVQVDPVALIVEGPTRTMNVRVNRATARLNWEKVPYRSYDSQVTVDCQNRRAGYVRVRYFMQPLWQGEAHSTADYTDDPRPMLFRAMEPNPTGRIVRAACRVKAN